MERKPIESMYGGRRKSLRSREDSLTTMTTAADMEDRPVPVVGLSVKRNSEAVISVVLGDDVKEKHSRSRSASNRGEYAKLLGFIYAILLIIIGFLLSLTEAVTNKWLGTPTNAAFQAYILIVATIFLLFLQFYLLRHHVADAQHACLILTRIRQSVTAFFDRFRRPSQRSANREAIRQLAAHTSGIIMATGEVSPRNDDPSDVNNNNNNNNNNQPKPRTVTFNIRNSTNIQRTSETFDGRRRGSFSSSIISARTLSPPGHETRPRSTGGRDEAEDDADTDTDEETMFWMDLDKLGNLFSHQGSSFYLRIGALFFGLGHVIYACLEIENWIHPDDCLILQYSYGWVFILRLVFIITQTFVLFKGSNVKITKHQSLALLGFMHLIATNLILWLITLMREVTESLHTYETSQTSPVDTTTIYPYGQYSTVFNNQSYRQRRAAALADAEKTGASNSSDHSGSCADSPLSKISRYLFPFVLEYSLIALGAIAFILFNGIGTTQDMHGHKRVARGFKNLIRVFGDSVYMDKKKSGESSANTGSGHHGSHKKSVLSKSHSGLFIGVLMLAAVLTCVVLFYFGLAVTDFDRSAQIYFITDIVLHGSLLVACCLALFFTRNLGYVARPLSTDDGLLFLTMSGSLVFELAVIVAAASHLGNMNSQLVVLDLVASIIASVETIIQTVLILNVMRRCPATASDVTDMPGRGTLAFLIIGNIADWIQRTMQVKELQSLEREDLYGSVPWLLLVNINLPLLLFFRFHSSVSLADAWHVAYTPLYHDVMSSASSSRDAARQQISPSLASSVAFSFPRSRQVCQPDECAQSDRSSESTVVILPTRISSSAPGSPRGRRRSVVSAISAAVLGENYRMANDDFPVYLTAALRQEMDRSSRKSSDIQSSQTENGVDDC